MPGNAYRVIMPIGTEHVFRRGEEMKAKFKITIRHRWPFKERYCSRVFNERRGSQKFESTINNIVRVRRTQLHKARDRTGEEMRGIDRRSDDCVLLLHCLHRHRNRDCSRICGAEIPCENTRHARTLEI